MTKKRLITYIILFTVILSPFCYIIYAYNKSYTIFSEFENYTQPLATKIYDIKGRLISELYQEYRKFASIKDIPQCVIDAFLAAEDKDFYLHTGFDLTGILRALAIDITSGSLRQGGSTITQQLVKQIYTDREKSVRRKLIELFITKEFEDRFTKDQILEMYLNHVYFGHGVYGVRAASEFYFGKDISKVNMAEAAVLAGIPSAPSKYSPLKNPQGACKRSESVMFNLIAQGKISKDTAASMFNSFWQNFLETIRTDFPDRGIRKSSVNQAPWFTEYIRRLLIEKYGEEMVYRGGLSVMTTLDIDYQKAGEKYLEEALERQNSIAYGANEYRIQKAESDLYKKSLKNSGLAPSGREYNRLLKDYSITGKTLREDVQDSLSIVSLLTGCDKIERSFNGFNRLTALHRKSSKVQGALVAVDPRTGGILTMVGGSGFSEENQLNRAVQSRRQPGSAFKVFVYGAAIESKKVTAASEFDDLPLTYKGKNDSWSPSNYSKKYTGRVLVRKALAKSLNVVPARIYDVIGGEIIARFASKMTDVPVKRFEIDPTLSLGSTEFSPMEMTKGIAVYANGGIAVDLKSITEIKDRNGKTLYKPADKKNVRLTGADTSFIMTDLLRGVVNSGTATYAVRKLGGFRLDCAGKTGTNTMFRDAWFTGYTGNLAATVWVGCDSPEYSLGHSQSGSVVAAPVWAKYMKEVYNTRSKSGLPGKPSGVTSMNICSVTGNRPGKGCGIIREYFIKGTEPAVICDGLHGRLSNIKELIRREKNRMKKNPLNGIFNDKNSSEKQSTEVHFFN